MGMLQVETSGRQIYYEHYKGSKTAVLLVHGWGMSCRVWDNVARGLIERGHEVIVFDQRCCGRSDKDFSDVSIAASVSDVLSLLGALEINQVVINGWSLGGAIATEAAHRLASRCSGLILTCAASPRYEQSTDFPYGVPAGAVAATVEAFYNNRIAFLYQLAQGVCASDPGDGVVDWLARLFSECGPRVGESIAELANIDQRLIWQQLTVPVLNIIGSKDSVADPGAARAGHSLLKTGRLVEFEYSGHAPFLEEFSGYFDEILAFLSELN